MSTDGPRRVAIIAIIAVITVAAGGDGVAGREQKEGRRRFELMVASSSCRPFIPLSLGARLLAHAP